MGDATAFGERLGDYLDGLTEAPTAPDAPGRVLVPGEPETASEAISRSQGVAVDARHIADLGPGRAVRDRDAARDATTSRRMNGDAGPRRVRNEIEGDDR